RAVPGRRERGPYGPSGRPAVRVSFAAFRRPPNALHERHRERSGDRSGTTPEGDRGDAGPWPLGREPADQRPRACRDAVPQDHRRPRGEIERQLGSRHDASSDCVAGAASVGAGVGPQFLTDIVGVAKAFTSRVGTGPFPTEVEGSTAEYLRERGGGEYGTTTRRPRRVGWLDLVMLRMAVRVNGLVSLAVTKLDVLCGLDRIPVGV